MFIHQLKEFQDTQHPLLILDNDVPLPVVLRQMDAMEYGSAICMKDGRYHGIFTTRQLLKKMAVNENIDSLVLEDAVRINGPVASLTDEAAPKLKEMNEAHVHYMPIIDEDGQCQGVLSQGDFAIYTLEQAAGRFRETAVERIEKKINPSSMVIAMAVYTAALLIAAVAFF